MRKKISLIALVLIIVDQLIKYIVVSNMSLFSSITIIKGFFNISYVINNGAGFSILSGNVLLLIIISLLVLYYIYRYMIDDSLSRIMSFSYAMIIGGAVGNMIDRIFRGVVVDYLDFYLGKWHYPTFNMADVFICVGGFLLIISLFRRNMYEGS